MASELSGIEGALVEFALADHEVPAFVDPCQALAAIYGDEGHEMQLSSERARTGPGTVSDAQDGTASRAQEVALSLFDRLNELDDGRGSSCLLELAIPTTAGVLALSPGMREGRRGAYAVGLEVSWRLADAFRRFTIPGVWSATGTASGIGAALACSRIAGLSPSETETALALAVAQSACLDVDSSHDLRRFRTAGITAFVGEAVLAARAGIAGSVRALSGDRGLFAVLSTPEAASVVGDSLGQSWYSTSVCQDGWPCPWGDCSCAEWKRP